MDREMIYKVAAEGIMYGGGYKLLPEAEIKEKIVNLLMEGNNLEQKKEHIKCILNNFKNWMQDSDLITREKVIQLITEIEYELGGK